MTSPANTPGGTHFVNHRSRKTADCALITFGRRSRWPNYVRIAGSTASLEVGTIRPTTHRSLPSSELRYTDDLLSRQLFAIDFPKQKPRSGRRRTNTGTDIQKRAGHHHSCKNI